MPSASSVTSDLVAALRRDFAALQAWLTWPQPAFLLVEIHGLD